MASSGALAVIFDFDGTLADSREVVLAAYNAIAPKLGARSVQRHELSRLQSLPPREALREYDVSWWKLPLLVHAVRRALRAEVSRIEPCPGVGELLRSLEDAGVSRSVLSTNATENIERFARRHGFPRFVAVRGGVSMFGKARALARFVRAQGLDASRVVYVGDEVRDVEAAREAGLRCVAVSWGFSGRSALVASAPWRLVDSVDELRAALLR